MRHGLQQHPARTPWCAYGRDGHEAYRSSSRSQQERLYEHLELSGNSSKQVFIGALDKQRRLSLQSATQPNLQGRVESGETTACVFLVLARKSDRPIRARPFGRARTRVRLTASSLSDNGFVLLHIDSCGTSRKQNLYIGDADEPKNLPDVTAGDVITLGWGTRRAVAA